MSKLTPEEAVRMQTHLETVNGFEPRRHPLNVVLIRSSYDPFEGPFEIDLGWKQAITGDTLVEVVPLRHHDFLSRAHIGRVAEVVKNHLNSRS